VVRVELDNGHRLVGLRYPEPLITEVSELIRQQKLNAYAVCIYFLVPKRLETTIQLYRHTMLLHLTCDLTVVHYG
jgi:hypothetical protein